MTDEREPSVPAATVTICDRQPVFAEGLARLLSSEGRNYSVLAVTTSPFELERSIRWKPPDVILLDAFFGVDGVVQVAAAAPHARVILLGTDEEQIDLPKALDAGASAYVLKDEKVSHICDLIEAVLRGYSVVPTMRFDEWLRSDRSSRSLTVTETDVLSLLARGATNREIARALNFSERTIRRYVLRIYSKLVVADRIQATLYAVRSGLVSADEVSRFPGS
ncbi:MAG: response regulator transcription factor [Actinomycetota bacterium]|nr:response regulator transcription factor [Actinomycetota bacterium]